jgi:hypothetical protein
MSGGDVVNVGRRHRRIDRSVGVRVIDHMSLGATGFGGKPRPFRPQPAQADAGRVDQVGRSGKLTVQQGDERALGREATDMLVRLMRANV